MMQDDRFADMLRQTLQEVDPPPRAPREEMWARIQAERAAARPAAGASAAPGVIELRHRAPRRSWVRWGSAMAAMLVLGIGIGRSTLQQATSGPADAPVASADAPAAAPDAVPTPYRLAATSHLQRTEMLLTSLPLEARRGEVAEVSSWARELITQTRLLLASPAADDPAMARLLEDVELVLSQIAAIPPSLAEDEVQLIQDALNQSDVLLRLRAATNVRRSVGT